METAAEDGTNYQHYTRYCPPSRVLSNEVSSLNKRLVSTTSQYSKVNSKRFELKLIVPEYLSNIIDLIFS